MFVFDPSGDLNCPHDVLQNSLILEDKNVLRESTFLVKRSSTCKQGAVEAIEYKSWASRGNGRWSLVHTVGNESGLLLFSSCSTVQQRNNSLDLVKEDCQHRIKKNVSREIMSEARKRNSALQHIYIDVILLNTYQLIKLRVQVIYEKSDTIPVILVF